MGGCQRFGPRNENCIITKRITLVLTTVFHNVQKTYVVVLVPFYYGEVGSSWNLRKRHCVTVGAHRPNSDK